MYLLPGAQLYAYGDFVALLISQLFAFEVAGMSAGGSGPGVLYVGSWSEWVASDERPVATKI